MERPEVNVAKVDISPLGFILAARGPRGRWSPWTRDTDPGYGVGDRAVPSSSARLSRAGDPYLATWGRESTHGHKWGGMSPLGEVG
jgi:hypothetical protein